MATKIDDYLGPSPKVSEFLGKPKVSSFLDDEVSASDGSGELMDMVHPRTQPDVTEALQRAQRENPEATYFPELAPKRMEEMAFPKPVVQPAPEISEQDPFGVGPRDDATMPGFREVMAQTPGPIRAGMVPNSAGEYAPTGMSTMDVSTKPIVDLPDMSPEVSDAISKYTDVTGVNAILRNTIGEKETSTLYQGINKGIQDLLESMTSPLGIATLGLGAAPKLAQKVIGGAFALYAGAQMPQLASDLSKAETPEEKKQIISAMVQQSAMLGGGGALLLSKGKAAGVRPAYELDALTRTPEGITVATPQKGPSFVVAQPSLIPKTLEAVIESTKLADVAESLPKYPEGYKGGAGAMGPVEAAEMKPSSTSTKNAQVLVERIARGEEPILKEETISNVESIAKAQETLKQDPNAAEVIIHELTSGEKEVRSISTADEAILMAKKVDLMNRVKKQEEILGDGNRSVSEHAAAKEALTKLEVEQNRIDEATYASGAEWGRMGQLRQRMLREDFSFEALKRKTKAKGEELTPEVLDRIKKQADEIAELTKKLAEKAEKGSEGAFDSAVKDLTKEGVPVDKVKRQRKTEEGTEGINRVTDRMKARLAEGDSATDLGSFIQQLAKQFVKKGVNEREALLDAVHGEVQKLVPEFTRRQTMDAISGYGEFSPLKTDLVSVTLRDLKGQMQQVGKIQDMEAGNAPKKTGVERRSPSDEERRLKKIVDEKKKLGGYTVTDPATQLKSAMDAIKTRLRNEISDLDNAIANKEPIANKKGQLEYDTEAKALREQRDAKKQQYDELFPKEPLMEAQKIERISRVLDRSIDRLENDLKTGKLYSEKGKRLTSPEVDAKRARLDALRNERELLRSLDTAGQDARSLQAFKTRTANRIADYQERIAKKQFEPKARKPEPKLDKEATDLRFKIEEVKKQFLEDRFKYQKSQWTKLQRTGHFVADVFHTMRALMTGGEMSGVLRQGKLAALSRPVETAKSLPAMFRTLGFTKETSLSAAKQAGAQILRGRPDRAFVEAAKTIGDYGRRMESSNWQQIKHRANYDLYQKSKLRLVDPDNFTAAQLEGNYRSRWANKIPGIAGSGRAYGAFLNELRVNMFDALASKLATREGGLSIEQSKAIATYVNEMTGSGGLGSHETSLQTLNAVFFSPRYVASRFQMLTGHSMWKGDAATRRLIVEEYAKILIGAALMYSIYLAADDDHKIEIDPRSKDFGKIKIGETRIDPLAGLQQVTVLGAQAWSGDITKPDGMIVDAATDRVNTAGKFVRSKMSPIAGTVIDLINRKDFNGRPIYLPESLPGIGLGLVTPMTYGEIYDTMRKQGVPAGVALSTLAFFGEGVNTYERNLQFK